MKRLMLLTGSLFAAAIVYGQPSPPDQSAPPSQPNQTVPPPGAGATIIETNAIPPSLMIKEYIIIIGTNAPDLATNVTQKLQSGYQPFGDVFHQFTVDTNSNTRSAEYCQPMIKYGQ